MPNVGSENACTGSGAGGTTALGATVRGARTNSGPGSGLRVRNANGSSSSAISLGCAGARYSGKSSSSACSGSGAAAAANACAYGAAAAEAIDSGVTGSASTFVRGIDCHIDAGAGAFVPGIVSTVSRLRNRPNQPKRPESNVLESAPAAAFSICSRSLRNIASAFSRFEPKTSPCSSSMSAGTSPRRRLRKFSHFSRSTARKRK